MQQSLSEHNVHLLLNSKLSFKLYGEPAKPHPHPQAHPNPHPTLHPITYPLSYTGGTTWSGWIPLECSNRTRNTEAGLPWLCKQLPEPVHSERAEANFRKKPNIESPCFVRGNRQGFAPPHPACASAFLCTVALFLEISGRPLLT